GIVHAQGADARGRTPASGQFYTQLKISSARPLRQRFEGFIVRVVNAPGPWFFRTIAATIWVRFLGPLYEVQRTRIVVRAGPDMEVRIRSHAGIEQESVPHTARLFAVQRPRRERAGFHVSRSPLLDQRYPSIAGVVPDLAIRNGQSAATPQAHR